MKTVSINGLHCKGVQIVGIEYPEVSVSLHTDGSPTVEIQDSCDDGTLALTGIVSSITDDSAGTTVTDQTLNITDTLLANTKYPNGFIYFNSGVVNANTVLGVDGTPDNPVNDETSAKTLADALGTKKIMIYGAFTPDATMDGYEFHSAPGGLAEFHQDGKTLTNNRFYNLLIDGTAVLDYSNNNQYYDCTYATDCDIGGDIYRCRIIQTIHPVSNVRLQDCYGQSVIFDCLDAEEVNIDINDLHAETVRFTNTNQTTTIRGHFVSGPSIGFDETCTNMGFATLTGIVMGVGLDPGATITVLDYTIKSDKANRSFNTSQYPNGFVYYSDESGVTNPEFGMHGTPGSPVGTVEAADGLGGYLAKKIMVQGDMTLDRNMDGYEFCGYPGGTNRLFQGNFSLQGCTFRNLQINGEALTLSDVNRYFDCDIVSGANVAGTLQRCRLHENVKCSATTWMHQCFSPDDVEFELTGVENAELSINELSCGSATFTGLHSTSSVFAHFNGSPLIEIDETSEGEFTFTGTVRDTSNLSETSVMNDHTLKVSEIEATHTNVQNVQTRIPAALVGGRMQSNLGAINGQSTSAETLQKGIDATITGVVGVGAHTTILLAATDLTTLTADAIKYRIINFTSGTNKGRSAPIISYNPTGGVIGLDPNYALPSTPSNLDKFTVT